MTEAGSCATEAKPGLQGGQLQVKIRDSDGRDVSFRIKTTTAMGKVFDAYCAKQGHTRSSMRFLFDGIRINDTATPEAIEIEDGDVIDALVEQVGG